MSILKNLFGGAESESRSLYEIFLQNKRGDLHKWHHYFDIYERYFAPYRGKPVRLLEIGVFRGGSLRLWRKYFGPEATIAGIDVDPGTAGLAEEGFQIFIGDQADAAFLAKVRLELGEVDIVLDDGGHTMRQQVNTFDALYSLAKDLYIVEDTHTSYMPGYADRPEGSFIEFAKAKIDGLHDGYASAPGNPVYRTRPSERTQDIPLSDFCMKTRGIHFYDSIVVFEKRPKAPRWSDVR